MYMAGQAEFSKHCCSSSNPVVMMEPAKEVNSVGSNNLNLLPSNHSSNWMQSQLDLKTGYREDPTSHTLLEPWTRVEETSPEPWALTDCSNDDEKNLPDPPYFQPARGPSRLSQSQEICHLNKIGPKYKSEILAPTVVSLSSHMKERRGSIEGRDCMFRSGQKWGWLQAA